MTLAALTAVVPLVVAASSPGNNQPYRFSPSGLAQDRFGAVTVPEEEQIPAHDNVKLRAQVYRPNTSAESSWKTPVILVHSPYFDSAHSQQPAGITLEEVDPIDALVRRYTPRGYTVVKSSMRGTGRSEGCFDNWGPDDAKDFKTLVEYFASQPWSNGRVASWGASAEGMTSNAALKLAPRGLVTAVVMLATSGMYDTYAFDGVPYSVRHLTPSEQSVNMLVDGGIGAVSGGPSLCTDVPEAHQANRSGTMTPYFQSREFRSGLEQAEASVLYVANLRDSRVLPIAIDGFYDRIPTFKRAVFGLDDHHWPWEAPEELRRNDWWAMFDAWFDHELLGLPTDIAAWPPVQVQDERNVWRAVDSFAAMGTARRLPLGDGVLGKAGAPTATVTFGELGAPAQWDSAPMTEPLHLSGQIRLQAPITLDKDEAHFMLTIQEVRADGTIRTLTNGFRSAQHRVSLTHPTEVRIGEFVNYVIRTQPFDAWVATGSHLRVWLGGNDDHDVMIREQPQVTGEPEGNGVTATIAVDGSAILELPIADDSCGLSVDQTQPSTEPIPSCPADIWSRWRHQNRSGA